MKIHICAQDNPYTFLEQKLQVGSGFEIIQNIPFTEPYVYLAFQTANGVSTTSGTVEANEITAKRLQSQVKPCFYERNIFDMTKQTIVLLISRQIFGNH